MIEVDGLVVRYAAVEALRGVSLSVGEGEAVAVIGPNGAGKTSLLKCIAGLVKPADGTVSLAGSRISGRPAYRVSRSGVALVPEGRAILAPLSVRQNLVLGGFHRPKDEVREDVDRMCELFPVLGDRLNSAGGLLSGGEQQMLAIARGLMAQPRVLMLDEPSMGLAPVIIDSIMQALQRVVEQGTTILLSEQNTALALQVTQRAYVLVNGEVVASGAGHELGDHLLERYLS